MMRVCEWVSVWDVENAVMERMANKTKRNQNENKTENTVHLPELVNMTFILPAFFSECMWEYHINFFGVCMAMGIPRVLETTCTLKTRWLVQIFQLKFYYSNLCVKKHVWMICENKKMCVKYVQSLNLEAFKKVCNTSIIFSFMKQYGQ